MSAAKALALAWDVPFVGVNHLEAHLYAAFLEDPTLELPLVVLLVSGGHTMLVEMRGHGDYRLLGQTIDDAAGEAFDKVARFLGLGYPGGPAIDAGRRSTATRRRSTSRGRCCDDGLDFTFCGLKTAVMNHVRKQPRRRHGRRGRVVPGGGRRRARRTRPGGRRAEVGAKGLVLGGGVAANSLLREDLLDACAADGLRGFLPEPGDVHRQRGDDRRRRLAPPPPRRPDPARRRRHPNLRLTFTALTRDDRSRLLRKPEASDPTSQTDRPERLPAVERSPALRHSAWRSRCCPAPFRREVNSGS